MGLHPLLNVAASLHFWTVSVPILRTEISCTRDERGFGYRDFEEKSLFVLLEIGLLSPCLLAVWDTQLCYVGSESRLGPHFPQ